MDIIKYHNDINKLKIGNFTENEIDIFFSLLLKAKETEDNILILKFSEFKSLIDVKNRSEDRFVKNVRGLNLKLKSLVQEIQDVNGDYVAFSLFGDIVTSPKRKVVEVEINPRFRHLIKELMSDFTIFELKELVELRGSYPKTLFRLLKQFESTKLYAVKIEDFRSLMGIPESYLMKNIRQKVLKPSLEQLGKYFQDLELVELKSGRSVETLKFTWKARKKDKKVDNKIQEVVARKGLGEKELQEYKKEQLEKNIEKLKENIVIDQQENKLEKISKEYYEELYKKYLEDMGEEHNIFIRKSFDFINRNKYEVQ